jgi:hypothetical protein
MRLDAESVPESGPEKKNVFWTVISSKWFTLFPATRPYVSRGFEQLQTTQIYPVAIFFLVQFFTIHLA